MYKRPRKTTELEMFISLLVAYQKGKNAFHATHKGENSVFLLLSKVRICTLTWKACSFVHELLPQRRMHV